VVSGEWVRRIKELENYRIIEGRGSLGTLVFVAAEEREFDGVRRHLRRVEKVRWKVRFSVVGELGGRDVALVANGPGPVLAAEAAQEAKRRLEQIDGFVSTGYCGALDNKLKPLGIVVASKVNGSTVNQPVVGLDYVGGPILSQDRVACMTEEKSRLRETGAIAVEMEAAGVAQVAREADFPFYCIRVVTDAASEDLPLDFNKMRDAAGRFSMARILAAAARRPGRILPGLMKLQRTSKGASLALGDFIANCRF
jgi:adenosylhomocysteine nucleosidase